MKKIILGIVLMLSVTLSAQNYSFFENDIRFNKNLQTVTLTHFGEFAITENFGFTDYAMVQNSQDTTHPKYGSYAEVLLGVYCKAIPNVTTSLYIGKESYTNSARIGAFASYIPSDKLLSYAFYQRNLNNSVHNEFWDVRLRFAPYSTDENSIYIGARYMTTYGLGMPIGYRRSITPTFNAYLAYTTYYDCTVAGTTSADDSARWVPTISLNFEFL